MQVKIDLDHIIDNVYAWSGDQKKDLNMMTGPGWGKIKPEPLGVALVMSSWNYPYTTGLPYVATCIAAGNCVLFKPSERAPNCSRVQKAFFDAFLDPRFYRCLEGEVQTAIKCTAANFDLIVFTGGT